MHLLDGAGGVEGNGAAGLGAAGVPRACGDEVFQVGGDCAAICAVAGRDGAGVDERTGGVEGDRAAGSECAALDEGGAVEYDGAVAFCES